MSNDTQEIGADGKPINPYIPKFISSKPWYNNDEAGDSLSHQRSDKAPLNYKEPTAGEGIHDGYKVQKDKKKKRKAKNALCDNCGSKLHLTRDCFEKPRKLKNRGIIEHAAEEVRVREVNSWDDKRDRWFGYDVSDYKLKDFRKADEAVELNSEEEDEIAEMLSLGLEPDMSAYGKKDGTGYKMSVRGMDDRAKYIDGIKEGKELDYDPSTRKIKDDIGQEQDGFVNAKDAAEFERAKRFNVNV